MDAQFILYWSMFLMLLGLFGFIRPFIAIVSFFLGMVTLFNPIISTTDNFLRNVMVMTLFTSTVAMIIGILFRWLEV